jgi:hypothetical protein
VIVGFDRGVTLHGMFLYRGKDIVAVPPPAFVQHFDEHGQAIQGRARGINDKNAVVGSFGQSAAEHAFFWDGTSAQSQVIPFLPNALWNDAYAINAQRMVVGSAMLKLGAVQVEAAFLWHADFGVIQLPGLTHLYPESPAWAYCFATDINNLKDSGLVQVAGTCVNGSGYHRAVRWDIHVIKVRKS